MPNVYQFVNADLIAAGLSPFAPEKEAIQAGKLMLKQIDELVGQGESFCVETTLAARGYIPKIPLWQKLGYTVHLVFLYLPNARHGSFPYCLSSATMQQGGHHIPDDVVKRRFASGLADFHCNYKQIVNKWILFDNSGSIPLLLAQGTNQL